MFLRLLKSKDVMGRDNCSRQNHLENFEKHSLKAIIRDICIYKIIGTRFLHSTICIYKISVLCYLFGYLYIQNTRAMLFCSVLWLLRMNNVFGIYVYAVLSAFFLPMIEEHHDAKLKFIPASCS